MGRRSGTSYVDEVAPPEPLRGFPLSRYAGGDDAFAARRLLLGIPGVVIARLRCRALNHCLRISP